jgi:RNA polymerase sigma-70 factor (ECF subfamily)
MEHIDIQKLKAGDHKSFKQVVENYQDMVVNTCYGFLHNKADAEDVAQEVFIEIYRSISGFNQYSTLKTWIYRVSVNKSLDFIKAQSRKKRWGTANRVELGQNEESLYQHAETPEEVMAQQERVAVLNQAINGLPSAQKTAFTLHKYEDLPYQEIAEILQTSLSSVESLMHRAKKNLKKKLYKYYKENL